MSVFFSHKTVWRLDVENKWIKVAASLEAIPFGANGLAEVLAGGKKICLGRYQGGLFAFAATCPHASGVLANGFIDARGHVVCPVHRYRFCPRSGRNVSGEGYHLKHWPVEVREKGVFVCLEGRGFLGLL